MPKRNILKTNALFVRKISLRILLSLEAQSGSMDYQQVSWLAVQTPPAPSRIPLCNAMTFSG